MTLDSRKFRDALGQFATGVTIITANDSQGRPIGVTVNSFSSVSLDPPLILWSVQKNSETAEIFNQQDCFCVNILNADAQALSNRYAQKDNHLLEAEHAMILDNGLPCILDTVVRFECLTTNRIDAGDHTILIAKVESISDALDAEPLIFHRGGYRSLLPLS